MTDHNSTQMDGASLDIAERRRHELKRLFPDVFTETKNDKGELLETIDFERLKAELGEFSEIYDNRRERYGMDWPGKRDCLHLAQESSYATLKPCRDESVDFDTTKNLFIEGDNLEVLKLLQKSYYGKIKMIYIDPPYNTGKEFIYPDNYSENLETYLAYAGLADAEGKKFSTNTKAEGRFHTKWLNMMCPRLYLAHSLLKEDGVIFISIDDNEVENLRRLCNELFGEENFLAQVIVQSNKRGQTYKEIAKCHEYILVYYKSDASSVFELEKTSGSLPYKDSYGEYDLWELRNRNPKFGKHNRPNLYYPIYVDETSLDEDGLAEISLIKDSRFSAEVFPKNSEGEDSCWRWGKDKLNTEGILSQPKTVFAKKKRDGGWNIYEKSRKSTTKVKSIWADNQVISEQGTVEAGKIGMGAMLEHPKPLELIKRCVMLGCNEDDDIVLDFFSGSGTTAHAVMAQNVEDGIKRRFICVQLPEPCTDNKSALEAGLRNIAEIGKERIRRSIQKIKDQVSQQLNFGNVQSLDLGFKVFRLDRSNFKQWSLPQKSISDSELVKQMELAVDHVNPNSTQEDLLYELLLKSGVSPIETIATVELAGHQVFNVSDGGLLVHLKDNIDKSLIDAILEQKPGQFICLDKAFHGNDELKANAIKAFETYNRALKNNDLPIAFRTV